MQRVEEGGLLPRGFSYGSRRKDGYVYRMLYFRWEGKQRRCLTHDLYVNPGINIIVGYSRLGWKLRPYFAWHFFYTCHSRQEAKG